jgi:O-antigen/teichoic acid export membrane protein
MVSFEETGSTSSPPIAAHAEPQPPSLKSRTIGGTVWTVVGYGGEQLLRFGSNLILTRLLFPEAFGLMALTSIFITGLQMLSDVGLGPAIIQSKHGESPGLLNTAWTVQIVRGFLLTLLAAGLAWPVSEFYREPQLLTLIPAASAGIALRGFTSTRVHVLNRQLNLRRLTSMELGVRVLAVLTTICAAWILRSVWALVIGSLIADIARVGMSHLLLPGIRNRLHWDRHAARELVRVGRWILLSTALTFGVQNLDQLTMGQLLSVRELGIYTIALFLSRAVLMAGRTIGSRVLFPMLSETVREDPKLLYSRLRRVRIMWVVPTAGVLVALAVGGDIVVEFLYPEEFHAAGWMLRILTAGSIAALLNQSTGVIWPSLGEFRMITVVMIVQMSVLFPAMIAGYTLYGIVGFVGGVALVELFVYPVQSLLARRRRLWQPEVDIPVMFVCYSLIGLGAWLART